MRNYAIAVSTKDAFCDSSPREVGGEESIFKTSASSFLVQERVVFSLIFVIILQDETFSMLENGVTQSMLLSNVKADQSSY